MIASPQMALTQNKTAPPRFQEGAVSNWICFSYTIFVFFDISVSDGNVAGLCFLLDVGVQMI